MLARARAHGTTPLLDVSATWCSSCAQLEGEVLLRPEAAGRLAGLEVGTIDFDSPEGQAVTERYRVVRLPTVLLLDADGAEQGRVEGYEDAEGFLAALDELRARGAPRSDDLRAVVAANPDAAAGWLALGTALLLREDPEEGQAALERAIALDPSGELGVAGGAYELLGRYWVRVRGEYAEAVARLAEGRYMTAGTPGIGGLTYWFAEAYFLGGEVEEATSALDRHTAAHPYEPMPFLLRADFCFERGLLPAQTDRDVGIVLSMSPPPEMAAAAYYIRARLRARRGRGDEAAEAIRAALERDPTRVLYRRFLERLREAPPAAPSPRPGG